MLQRHNTRRELFAILGIVGVLMLGFALTESSRGGEPRQAGAVEPSATVATAATQPASSPTLPVSTATPTGTITVPGDAQIQTAEQAVALAKTIAGPLGAENPRVVAVELLTLQEAFVAAQLAADEDPSLAMEGQDPAQALLPVWRVQLDNDQFQSFKCPQGATCGSTSTAAFILNAIDGSVMRMQFGIPVGVPVP